MDLTYVEKYSDTGTSDSDEDSDVHEQPKRKEPFMD